MAPQQVRAIPRKSLKKNLNQKHREPPAKKAVPVGPPIKVELITKAVHLHQGRVPLRELALLPKRAAQAPAPRVDQAAELPIMKET